MVLAILNYTVAIVRDTTSDLVIVIRYVSYNLRPDRIPILRTPDMARGPHFPCLRYTVHVEPLPPANVAVIKCVQSVCLSVCLFCLCCNFRKL